MPDADTDAPRGPFLYFSYGSNLDIERLHMHAPSARLISAAQLDGYRVVYSIESKRSWLGGVGDIVESPGEELWGALWVIEAADSHGLDEQEGVFRDPPAYRRITVEVTTSAGDVVRCRSYRVVTPDPAGFLPSPAYKATILRGARAVGLPEAYIASLAATPDNGREGGGAH